MTKPKQTVATVEPLLYSIDQTCARLNVGRTTLYAEMAAGELDYVQIRDRRLTTDEQQRAYIERKQRRASGNGGA
jgi:predicted site-specific integrase-resolvase